MRAEAAEYSEEYRSLVKQWEKTLSTDQYDIVDYYRTMALWEEDVHDAEYAGIPPYQAYASPPESDKSLAI